MRWKPTKLDMRKYWAHSTLFESSDGSNAASFACIPRTPSAIFGYSIYVPPRCVLLRLILVSSVPNAHGAVHRNRPPHSDQPRVFSCWSQRGSSTDSDKCRLCPSALICALRLAEAFFHLCQFLQEERKYRIQKDYCLRQPRFWPESNARLWEAYSFAKPSQRNLIIS